MSRGTMLNFLDSARDYIDTTLQRPAPIPRTVNLRRFLQKNLLRRPTTKQPPHPGPIRQPRRRKNSKASGASTTVASPATLHAPGVTSADTPLHTEPCFASAPTSTADPSSVSAAGEALSTETPTYGFLASLTSGLCEENRTSVDGSQFAQDYGVGFWSGVSQFSQSIPICPSAAFVHSEHAASVTGVRDGCQPATSEQGTLADGPVTVNLSDACFWQWDSTILPKSGSALSAAGPLENFVPSCNEGQTYADFVELPAKRAQPPRRRVLLETIGDGAPQLGSSWTHRSTHRS
ncbi:hypothetical protein BaRGS_00015449 [Batillaria attramentaria]|uniref:Uncharacterized protein n=1 Tax=Batillaria attramentaria TaxID=370345 RepID=A0ABD0L283_9CAEN